MFLVTAGRLRFITWLLQGPIITVFKEPPYTILLQEKVHEHHVLVTKSRKRVITTIVRYVLSMFKLYP